MQVTAVVPWTRAAEKALRSACTPAPPPLSEPAIVKAVGLVGWEAIGFCFLTQAITGLRTEFNQKKRLKHSDLCGGVESAYNRDSMFARYVTGAVGAVLAGLLAFGLFELNPASQQHPPSLPVTAPQSGTPQLVATQEIVDGIPPKKTRQLRPSGSITLSEPAFVAFNDWMKTFERTRSEDKQALISEGVQLARRRRSEMVDLIESDPKRALELSVNRAQYSRLPETIQVELEELVSAKGDLEILGALPAQGETVKPLIQQVVFGTRRLEAFLYGRRLGEPTRRQIALSGIVLDGQMAVDENPARMLAPEEVTWLRSLQTLSITALCDYSGQRTDSQNEETVVEIAGEVIPLCTAAHAELLNEETIEAEASGGEGGSGGVLLGDPVPSAYTEGIKDIIVIRIDFSDLDGEPFSLATGTNIVLGLDTFYREMSYAKAGFSLVGFGSEVTPVFRMPRTAADYGTNDPSVLRSAARAAATTAGYQLSTFNFDLICFGDVPGFKFAGLGYIGGPGAWIRGTSSVGVIAHELGHNYGLNHANFWETSGQSIIGSGTSVEYGDKFDTMGNAAAGSKHFNARYKNYLNWLTTSDVTTVSQSGTYRIYAHDDPASTGVRALKTSKNSNTNYWVEYRSRYGANKWVANGVGIRWAGLKNQSSTLLDVSAGSPDGKDDSPLLIGRTFSDLSAGVHITPIGLSGTVPAGMDIVVKRGSFPANIAPVAILNAPATNGAINAVLSFSVSATDADGDALAYFWDFGDGSFGSNSVTQTHAWIGAGEYAVQCTVTDMKGGLSVDSVLVKVGNPTTYRIGGRVWENGVPLLGVKVSVSSTKMGLTDSSGRYYITGLPAGAYSVQAAREGFAFARSGFMVPLAVGPSRQGMDFVAIPSASESTLPLVAAGSVWQYLDDGTNPGTAWRQLAFNDITWGEGPAPLGYGDNSEKTVVRYGNASNNKYVTTFFRRSFEVANLSGILGLTLGLQRDDGGVVYLNGREVFRSNMPTGSITYTTLASTSVGNADETAFFETEISRSDLQIGTNLFAVEIHQNSRTSSDIAFDLWFEARLAAGVAPPQLSADLETDKVVLTWPDTGLEWVPMTTADLTSTLPWLRLTETATKGQGLCTLRLPLTGDLRFFKLTPP